MRVREPRLPRKIAYKIAITVVTMQQSVTILVHRVIIGELE
jgi:hypothetical protein